jgi:hypothetical protein
LCCHNWRWPVCMVHRPLRARTFSCVSLWAPLLMMTTHLELAQQQQVRSRCCMHCSCMTCDACHAHATVRTRQPLCAPHSRPRLLCPAPVLLLLQGCVACPICWAEVSTWCLRRRCRRSVPPPHQALTAPTSPRSPLAHLWKTCGSCACGCSPFTTLPCETWRETQGVKHTV